MDFLLRPVFPASRTNAALLTASALALATLHCGESVAPKAHSTYGLEVRPATSPCRGPSTPTHVRLTRAFAGTTFERPTKLARPNATSPWFVSEQGGRVLSVADDGATRVVADLRDRVLDHDDEAGLLGLAFSPDYAATGEFFVSYTAHGLPGAPEGQYRFVVSRLRETGSGAEVDLATERQVLAIERSEGWHHGGALAFGRARELFVSVGDGAFGDPGRRAPNPNELFGKILRINVLDGETPYGLFADNPFVLTGRPEVYATGFRNPWTMSFGPDGKLWVGDVGHFRWEEIDVVEKGRHYGWPDREGTHCTFADPCTNDGIAPVVEYSHLQGQAVTGGFVYLGARIPELAGRYVFGDFGSGRIWSVDATSPDPSRVPKELVDTGMNLSAFGQDSDGELVVADYVSGAVFRLEPGPGGEEEQATLKGLGCLEADGRMDERLVAYDVAAPLWSDGLDKHRWFSLPERTSLQTNEDGSWSYPVGTVLLKEFSLGARKVETRMMVNEAERGWLGYAFEWNDEGTDATLLVNGKTKDLGSQTWDIPPRTACFTCHNATAGRVLGLVHDQTNRPLLYPSGVVADQLPTLEHVGLLQGAGVAADEPHLADPYSEQESVNSRARAYLQGNCAHCHRSHGFDFRSSAPLEGMGLWCRPAYATIIADSPLLAAPGDPTHSVLVHRVSSTGDLRMPPLGTRIPDSRGVALLTTWIGGLPACP